MDVEEALEVIGLSDKEVSVYLANLRLGSATVNQISKEAGTFRTYTYDVLKSLMQQGLVNYVMKDKKQYFEASDPERIIELLEEKQDTVREVLPKLKALQASVVEKPSVEFYEGLAGVNHIHDMILREKPKEVRIFGNPEQHIKVMSFHLPRFVQARAKKNVWARIILKDSAAARELMKKRDKKECRETRFFPSQPKEFPAIAYMWNDKIAYFTIEKKIVAVVIENENIAKLHQVIFENLWNKAKKN